MSKRQHILPGLLFAPYLLVNYGNQMYHIIVMGERTNIFGLILSSLPCLVFAVCAFLNRRSPWLFAVACLPLLRAVIGNIVQYVKYTGMGYSGLYTGDVVFQLIFGFIVALALDAFIGLAVLPGAENRGAILRKIWSVPGLLCLLHVLYLYALRFYNNYITIGPQTLKSLLSSSFRLGDYSPLYIRFFDGLLSYALLTAAYFALCRWLAFPCETREEICEN